MLRCDEKTGADLQVLGLGKEKNEEKDMKSNKEEKKKKKGRVGEMQVSKNSVGKPDLKLVNQSVTGLFESVEKL